jgi:hypothetical protein
MIHEVEEYVLSPEGFKEFINKRSPLGTGSDSDFPLDEGYIFQVNIIIAWPVIILGAALANIAPWVGMSMIWFQIIVNNLMHTIGFQKGKPTYNPDDHELPHHRAVLRCMQSTSIWIYPLVGLGTVAPARSRHHRLSDEKDIWPPRRSQGQNTGFRITAILGLCSGRAGRERPGRLKSCEAPIILSLRTPLRKVPEKMSSEATSRRGRRCQ